MNASGAMPEAPEPAPDHDMPGFTPDEPVSSAERIVALDFIRGVAVLGILFPNIVAYGHPMLAYYWPEGLPGGASAFDRLVWLFQFVLIDGKFRGLFTLLFGAGLFLFAERVEARGGAPGLPFRRLAWLALFGLAHTFLIWRGDILLLYACTGLVGLAMLGWRPMMQLTAGVAWFIAGSLLVSLLLAGQAAGERVPSDAAAPSAAHEQVRQTTAGIVAEAAREVEVMREGSFPEIVGYRLAEEGPGLLRQTVFFALVETLPLILIGMALYRLGLFDRRMDRAWLRRWGWIGLAGGAVLTLPLGLWVMSAGYPLMLTQLAFNGLSAVLHLPMILGLTALLALWAPAASRGWLGSRFVAAGRMAFSNYICTSLVMMLVFQGWAGGLFGQLHRGPLLVLVVLGWILMLAWSKPWLARFRYGPLEWLWRCLTYGKRFPLRR